MNQYCNKRVSRSFLSKTLNNLEHKGRVLSTNKKEHRKWAEDRMLTMGSHSVRHHVTSMVPNLLTPSGRLQMEVKTIIPSDDRGSVRREGIIVCIRDFIAFLNSRVIPPMIVREIFQGRPYFTGRERP